MRKMIAGFLILLVLSLAACGADDNRIRVPRSANDLEGENYKDVITMLEVAGFTNVEVEVLDDLILGWLTKDGEVSKVSINGETDFLSESRFPIDARIVITYHTFPLREEEQVAETSETQEPQENKEEPKVEETTEDEVVDATTEQVETNEPADEEASLLAEPLDLDAINNTNSVESDAQFVGKFYKITGVIEQAMSSEGLNPLIIIQPSVMAKGMGESIPLEINIWLTPEEFEQIDGINSVGTSIEITKELKHISRNTISKDLNVLGYPIQLEFGDYQ